MKQRDSCNQVSILINNRLFDKLSGINCLYNHDISVGIHGLLFSINNVNLGLVIISINFGVNVI